MVEKGGQSDRDEDTEARENNVEVGLVPPLGHFECLQWCFDEFSCVVKRVASGLCLQLEFTECCRPFISRPSGSCHSTLPSPLSTIFSYSNLHLFRFPPSLDSIAGETDYSGLKNLEVAANNSCFGLIRPSRGT